MMEGVRTSRIGPSRLMALTGAALLFLAANVAARAGQLSFLAAEVQGVDGVNGLDVAISIAVSPDGRHVYAPSFVDSAIAVFAPEPERGLAVSAVAALVGLAALARRRQRGVRITTGMSRFVPAWYLS